MKDSKSQLLARKRDVLEALRILEQDRDDGLVDEETYAAVKQRHEHEAVQLLAQLDALGEGADTTPPQGVTNPIRRRRGRLIVAATIILCLAGALGVLVTALHQRAPGETITGATGRAGTANSEQSALSLQTAQQAVYQHPRSYQALVNLGSAYLQNGRVMEADLSYQAAMGIDPTRAAAPTFHAMLLGAVKRYPQALDLLSMVERKHPGYARAWLMDGILSSHVKDGRARALSAWLRFLLLEPRSELAPKVKHWILQLERRK